MRKQITTLAALITFALAVFSPISAWADWYPYKADTTIKVQGETGVPYANMAYLGTVASYDITPTIANTSGIHAAVTLGAATQTVTTAITNPDVPRTVSITGSAGGITGNVVITGKDIAGTTITDTIALNGTSTVQGAKAFRIVTSIALPVKTHTSGDTVSVGRGTSVCFPNIITVPNYLGAWFDGSTDSGSMSLGGTLATNLYTPAGALDGVKHLKFIYVIAH